MTPHVVRLPHPDRHEPTVGRCDSCPWHVVYGWGGHGEAETFAAEHVEQECASESVVAHTVLLIDRRIFTADPGAFAHRMQMEGIKRAMRADLEILLDAFAARWGITR